MAKKSQNKKTDSGESKETASKKTVKYTSSVSSDSSLLYGREFYIWMLAGLALIILGFVLMAGGNQAPNEWNSDEIYSFRRTGLAPLVIVAGLVVEIYAIFKK